MVCRQVMKPSSGKMTNCAFSKCIVDLSDDILAVFNAEINTKSFFKVYIKNMHSMNSKSPGVPLALSTVMSVTNMIGQLMIRLQAAKLFFPP